MREEEAKAWLQRASPSFRALADHLPLGVCMNDAKGGCVYANAYCCRMLEASAEELAGEDWSRLLHPDDRDRTLREWNAAREAAKDFQATCRFVTRSTGRVLWVAARVTALRDENGAAAGFLGTISDETERVLASAEVARTSERLQAAFDASPLGILSVDAAGRVTGWSGGAERMFGWREDEVVGRTCPTVPDDWSADFHDMVRTVLAGTPFHGLVRLRRRKDGEAIRARIWARARSGGGLDEGEVIIVLDDVTEQERRAEALQQLIDERERFVADLHDGSMQSLLAIGLALEKGARGPAGEGDLREAMRESARRLLDVIAEMRGLVLHGERSRGDRPWDVEAAIRSVVDLHGDGLPSCTVDFDSDALRCLTREQALQIVQIAREAVSNAARHSRARHVRLSLRRDGALLRFEVEDDGVGIRSRVPQGKGLRNIELRALGLGGRAVVLHGASAGTRIVVEIPVFGTEQGKEVR